MRSPRKLFRRCLLKGATEADTARNVFQGRNNLKTLGHLTLFPKKRMYKWEQINVKDGAGDSAHIINGATRTNTAAKHPGHDVVGRRWREDYLAGVPGGAQISPKPGAPLPRLQLFPACIVAAIVCGLVP